MNVFFINYFWEGNFINYIAKGFQENGVQAIVYDIHRPRHWLNSIHLHNITSIRNYADYKIQTEYNHKVLTEIKKVKPDVFFSFNNSRLFPETVKAIRDEIKCRTVCVVADSPFDSSRSKYSALALQYFDFIFVSEKMWIPNIRKVAPKSNIEFSLGGYDPDLFKPVSNDSITEQDKTYLECDVSFTGSAYGENAEGSYRAAILGSLEGFNVKIWGDNGWKYRGKYYPVLRKAYQGKRLPYDMLLKLFTLSKINLNMPSPQILTAFQPRVFEIAAAKGFQIIDYRDDLLTCYDENDIVTFKTLPELIDKINYYNNSEVERNKIVERMFYKTSGHHTWKSRAGSYLEIIT